MEPIHFVVTLLLYHTEITNIRPQGFDRMEPIVIVLDLICCCVGASLHTLHFVKCSLSSRVDPVSAATLRAEWPPPVAVLFAVSVQRRFQTRCSITGADLFL